MDEFLSLFRQSIPEFIHLNAFVVDSINFEIIGLNMR